MWYDPTADLRYFNFFMGVGDYDLNVVPNFGDSKPQSNGGEMDVSIIVINPQSASISSNIQGEVDCTSPIGHY